MSPDEMKKKIAELELANAALKSANDRKVTLKVSEKGAVSVYGMGRFPVTLYREQWLKLLGMEADIVGFITLHADRLVLKTDDEATLAQKAKLRGVSESTKPVGPAAAPPTTVKSTVTRHPSRS